MPQFRPGLGLVLVALAGACKAPCPPAAASPSPARAERAVPPPSASPLAVAPAASDDPADPHLVGFSRAHCFALYLRAKGWDDGSARNIAGGFVELGSRSAEAYEALASFIAGFEPPLGSQQPIDPLLSRCFQIEDSADWQRLVRAR